MKNQPFETAQKCVGCVLSDHGLLAQVNRLNKEIKPISSAKKSIKVDN